MLETNRLLKMTPDERAKEGKRLHLNMKAQKRSEKKLLTSAVQEQEVCKEVGGNQGTKEDATTQILLRQKSKVIFTSLTRE